MAQHLKIGIYADKYRPASGGGVDTHFTTLIESLARYEPQHEYIILAQPQNSVALAKRFASLGVRIHELNSSRLLSRLHRITRRYLPRVAKNETAQINALHCDLVYFPRSIVHVFGLRTLVVLYLFDLQHEYYPEFFTCGELELRTGRYRQSVAEADLIIAPTQYTRHTIIEKMEVAPEQVQVIYPGAGALSFHPDADAVEKVRAKYQLPSEFMLYPANPWIHKNHARLLAALRLIRDRYQRILPIVFTGRLDSEPPGGLKRLALAAGVESQVWDLGFVSEDDLAALYAGAHFMIFPSLFEGFGLPLLEAMARGCPVTCANATCLPEVAGDAAYLFDALDIEAIAQAIVRMWDDDQLRAELQTKGIQREKLFSWQQTAHDLLGTFTEALATEHPET